MILLLLACQIVKEIDTSEPPLVVENHCAENGSLSIPEDAEWIILDGNSDTLFSLAEGVLAQEWQGNYGTYEFYE